MNRLRRLSFWMIGVATSSGVLALACSTTNEPLDLGSASDTTPDASLDAGASPDVVHADAEGPTDAGDARPPFDPADELVVCAKEPCPTRIVAGADHFCVLMSNGTVRCWGSDANGQVGSTSPSPEPFVVASVEGITRATQISAAAATTCAVLDDGGVECWGANDMGQLGLASEPAVSDGDAHPSPAPVALSGSAKRVDVGQRSVCAVLATRDVWCWGSNDRGLLGRSSDVSTGGPAKFSSLTGTSARTTAGTYTAFALDDQGIVSSWGAVAGIQGSIAGRVSSTTPALVPSPVSVGPFTSFAVSSWFAYQPPYSGTGSYPSQKGIAHACGVVDGGVQCWGESTLGAIGTGVPKQTVVPTPIAIRGKAYAQQIAVSRENTCVRLDDGSIQCAGDNARGQLGREADAGAALFGDYFEPATSFTGHAVQVAVSNQTTCALVQGGNVACWGGNEHGELGQGTTDDDSHPTPVMVLF